MAEMLTIEQIEAQYAPEWVLIAEPQTEWEAAAPRRQGGLPQPRSCHRVG
jgi:hypothetical protein